jgi:hypothetical protein
MTDPTYLPPPVPAPSAPPVKRRKTRYLVAGGIALFVIGVLAAPDSTQDTAPATTLPPATTVASTTTLPPTTTTIPDPLVLWIAEHGPESAVVMAELGNYSQLASDAIDLGDAVTLWLTCDEAVDYLDDVESDAVSLDPNAPMLWGKTIGYWKMGFQACTDADLEGASTYLGMGTDALSDLTDLIESATL